MKEKRRRKKKKQQQKTNKQKTKKKQERTIEVWTCDLEFYKTDAIPAEIARILWYVSTFRRFKAVTAQVSFNAS